MTTSTSQVTSVNSAPAPTTPIANEHHGFGFRDLLSALNPLQYLPVVGTIYRAATGDVIPEPLRRLGSLLVSGLLGGPVGVAISLASTVAEKITGIDPEKIVGAHFNTAPPVSSAAPPVVAAQPRLATIAPASSATPTPSASFRLAMSPAQLAAYGVRVDRSGNLRRGDVSGADVLNDLELARHAKATAAYAVNQPWAHA
jgi:hypothetical protein